MSNETVKLNRAMRRTLARAKRLQDKRQLRHDVKYGYIKYNCPACGLDFLGKMERCQCKTTAIEFHQDLDRLEAKTNALLHALPVDLYTIGG
jgi:hypothetical protein